MSRHSEQEPANQDGVFDGDGEQVYLPFAGRSRADSGNGGEPFDELDDELAAGSSVEGVRLRPPPRGLSRGDRREWQRLEVARVNRQAQALVDRRHGTAGGWSGGFMKNPPRGLGRKGRNAWHTAEQEATKAWWAQRRASNHDIDARAAGAAVLALVIGIAVVVALAVHRSAPAGSATEAPPQVGMATGTTSTMSGGTVSAAQRGPALVVPGATGPVAVASANTAIGVTPTVAPPLAGLWQPTPAGGVPATTPTAALPINPAAVKVQQAPVGAVTPADQASPQAAVTAWLARTCPSSWRNPFGADLTRGKALETAAAWKADTPAHDTVGAALWRSEVVAHQQTRVCGNLQVVLSPDQPITAGGGFVLYSAQRIVTSAAGHLPVTVERLSGGRRVVKQAGVWRVDIAVVGG